MKLKEEERVKDGGFGFGVDGVRFTFSVRAGRVVRVADDELSCASVALFMIIDLSGFTVRLNFIGIPTFEIISGGGTLGSFYPYNSENFKVSLFVLLKMHRNTEKGYLLPYWVTKVEVIATISPRFTSSPIRCLLVGHKVI
ncbi:hypothetical protein R6Q59_026513 [Mikania micrantha]